MSTDIHYFFTAPASLPEIRDLLNERLGVSITTPDRGCIGDFLTMELMLGEDHMLVDDMDLNFEAYKHTVVLTGRSGLGGDLQLPGILMVMHFLHLEYGVPGMLVYNVEQLLARFVLREVNGAPRLVDEASGLDALDFEANLRSIRRILG